MLTVAEVLKLNVMIEAKAHTVAGEMGLDREISWVHNAGVPDAPLWVNGGELILTTFINLPETIEARCSYIRQMAAKDVAAIVITTGYFIDRTPDYLRETADQCGIPLIEMDYQARFVNIAKSINEYIAQENMRIVRRALTIHQTLTNLVLQGGGLQQLAHKLADLVGHSISIESDQFEAIATVNLAEVDEARRYTQIHKRTDPRLVSALETRGFLPEIRQNLRPVHLVAMPDVGLEMERILAPIVVHGEIYGFMWIIADVHHLSDIDMMAIESGSTIAALMLLHQESVQSAEASLRGGLLSQLIKGDLLRESIVNDQSLRYGVDLRLPFVLVSVQRTNSESQTAYQWYRQVIRVVNNHHLHAVVGQFGGDVVILAQANKEPKPIVEEIMEQLTQANPGIRKSIRIAISGVHKGAQQVALAYRQGQDALHIANRLGWKEDVLAFEELGYLYALYHAGQASLEGNVDVPRLKALLQETQADLFHTLEAYLDAGGNGVQTAEILHIHRSTLNYRLEKIKEICQLDLTDPLVRTNLQITIKLMRLFELDKGQ
ncbi:PucR family transcriptional regulator [Anaerolineales bacterium]